MSFEGRWDFWAYIAEIAICLGGQMTSCNSEIAVPYVTLHGCERCSAGNLVVSLTNARSGDEDCVYLLHVGTGTCTQRIQPPVFPTGSRLVHRYEIPNILTSCALKHNLTLQNSTAQQLIQFQFPISLLAFSGSFVNTRSSCRLI